MANEKQAGWIERMLGIRLDALPTLDEVGDDEVDLETAKAELEELGLQAADVWRSAVEAFRAASDEADGQIGQLQAALRETDDPDLHDIAEYGLNAMTGNTRVPLQAAILEAGKGGREQLKTAAPKVLKAVGAFRAQLASPQITACDNNPFGVDVAIGQTFSGALNQLALAVRLAA